MNSGGWVWLWVALGGAMGATARFGVGRLIGSGAAMTFPWATYTVNIVGSFLVGLLMAGASRGLLPEPARAFLGIGVLGGFTTFSTFSADLVAMTGTPAGMSRQLLYCVASVAGGWLAAWAGFVLGLGWRR